MDRNKMLIDASHPEETRVVVLRNGRVEEFDYESASRKLLRGNIYLAKVTRVEPSLQAAFVDYGGNRHGFLAFNEIHPDYYQIPVADRELLKQEEAEAEAAAEAEADERAQRRNRGNRQRDDRHRDHDDAADQPRGDDRAHDDHLSDGSGGDGPAAALAHDHSGEARDGDRRLGSDTHDRDGSHHDGHGASDREAPDRVDFNDNVEEVGDPESNGAGDGASSEPEQIELVGAEEDALEELPERPRRRARQYKIQEVIKRRQIILIQVVKEERGNKGAALTTYISLAGRYTVLMPNTGRGGGISRKITQPQDRKRLKAIAEELDVAEGMGLIIRTAGAARTKQEIKRDYEYLLRLWESVRDMTLSSTAPCLVYEEGNLIKRSIRDLYSKDIDDIVVSGEASHIQARDFMTMLMPGHGDQVIRYDAPEPVFTKYGIERQLNALFSPYVTLRSGGYLVINQTEALVAIDVNSGKSTREFSIEETALNTNMEAAEEIARQLKLRDLAGLIVVDFIDMEEKRNNRTVERRMKDALRHDRARIQVGRISHFGLLEMSRQRLRTGVLEGSTSQCPHCQGTGIIRSVESVALAVLRGIEDQLLKQPSSLKAVTTADVALYILNHKRSFITEMEARHGIVVTVEASDRMHGANFAIEKTAAVATVAKTEARTAVSMDWGFDGEEAVEAEAPRERERERDRDPERGRQQERGRGREPARDDGDRDHAQRDDRDQDTDGDQIGERHARDDSEAGGSEDGGPSRRRRRRRGRRDRDGNEGGREHGRSEGGQRDGRGQRDEHRPERAGEGVNTAGVNTAGVVAAGHDNGRGEDERYQHDRHASDAPPNRPRDVDGLPRAGVGADEPQAGAGADEPVTVGERGEREAGDDRDGGDDRPRRGRRRGRRGGRGRAREGNDHAEANGAPSGGDSQDRGDWSVTEVARPGAEQPGEAPRYWEVPVAEPARRPEAVAVEPEVRSRSESGYEAVAARVSERVTDRMAIIETAAAPVRAEPKYAAPIPAPIRLVESIAEPKADLPRSVAPVAVTPVPMPAPLPAPTPVTATVPAPAAIPSASQEPARPTRKGWWQRNFGGE